MIRGWSTGSLCKHEGAAAGHAGRRGTITRATNQASYIPKAVEGHKGFGAGELKGSLRYNLGPKHWDLRHRG